jgi:hypothetical protein
MGAVHQLDEDEAIWRALGGVDEPIDEITATF